MASNRQRKTDSDLPPREAAVIGDTVAALQSALTLAQMGIAVKLVTKSVTLGTDYITRDRTSADQRYLWPLLLHVASHPLIKIYNNTGVENITRENGHFKLQLVKQPRYIYEELCSACGQCEVECSARITSLQDGRKVKHGAIHAPALGRRSVPSAYIIDKNGYPPCRAGCPLGINVQGFISLLYKGKTDKALALISEASPFGGILGRVCRHPCEEQCYRAKVDEPVSIRALHRFAADNAMSDIKFSAKAPAASHADRVAIVGSGPAGLTAAWELTRRGYSPTVFEAHGVIGGTVATGIPRFRLPREVRERDIKAIQDLGVDIRTGTTVGRDVTFSYLKERGYKAFFLAIGAQHNNRLNIPGEDLAGVVDCMSLLFTLNMRMDALVGANIVIIGDGNSAIDSARAAIRKNRGAVRVLSWTIPEEITANEEEVMEALEEGVSIQYCTSPVEILGDGGRVTGIRCRRTRLTDKLMANGRHLPEPIPGTDFILEADHVVVAIGQSPDAPQLNIEGLEIDRNTGIIRVNPLTMATSLDGVFAGGDCITGPNNVVAAMAAGIRAAESIDRYMQGKDISAERSLEPPPLAEVDLDAVTIIPHSRAKMPAISPMMRIESFEETTTGLTVKAAERESERCLNCGLCSQCLECTVVCELGAVCHDDMVKKLEIPVAAVLQFSPDEVVQQTSGAEARTFYFVDKEPSGQMNRAVALALETAIELKGKKASRKETQTLPEVGVVSPRTVAEVSKSIGAERLGVFLCRCNNSISSVVDFQAIASRLSGLPGIEVVEIPQACTEAGAKQMAVIIKDRGLDRLVLAACRCCNFEQICYSCTDRRRMCLDYTYQNIILPGDTIVEFCNIREQCAWAHRDDPGGALQKALRLITAGIARVRLAPLVSLEEKGILHNVIIIGGGPITASAAKALAGCGYQVEMVIKGKPVAGRNKNLLIKSWPERLELGGTPGEYEITLGYGQESDCFQAGAILIEVDELKTEERILSAGGATGRLMKSLIARKKSPDKIAKSDILRQLTIGETAGIFLASEGDARTPDDKAILGLVMAARISAYLEQKVVRPRAAAVSIDSKMCRACGNCAEVCPYIEVRCHTSGTTYMYIEKSLCLGCGACIATCPTGAIHQTLQSDKQITVTLQSILGQS